MTLQLPKKKRNWRKLKWNCFFEYVSKEGSVVIGKGRKMRVDGVEIELFPSAVLCGMLWRDLRCLYKWERDFGFPQSLWRIRDDTHTNRWYTRKQLIAIRSVYEHFNRLRGKNRPDLRTFIAAVRDFFYTIDSPKGTNNESVTTEGHGASGNTRDRGAA